MPTAKDWKALIADPKYKDDVKLTLGEGVEVTLGDIRAASKADQDDLTKRLAQLETDRKQLEAAQQTVATNFAKLVEAGLVAVDADGNIQVKEPPVAPPTHEPGKLKPVDYDRDSYVGPVVKMVKELQAQLTASAEASKKLLRDFNAARALAETDRLQRDFASHADWPKDYTFEQAMKDAAAQRVYDPFGRLNLQELHTRVTEPARRKVEIETEAKRLADQQVQERLASLAARPGMAAREPGKARPKSLDEAIAQAGQDPEILQGLNNILPA